jgi:hypothetical protein
MGHFAIFCQTNEYDLIHSNFVTVFDEAQRIMSL